MGSMVEVVASRGYYPRFTLVELDKTILEWALEFMPVALVRNIEPICEDAGRFMVRNRTKYDFIFIDIFNNREVPGFVFTESFLVQCRNSLRPGGHLAFNYIVNSVDEWEQVQCVFGLIFPGFQVISRSINKILVH